jgi:hypothetical protein
MKAGFEEVRFFGISNVRREFIVDFGAEEHGAMGEEGMGVERYAYVITVTSGMVVDRGIEFKEGKVAVHKRTGNLNECTSEGKDFQGDKKEFTCGSTGATGDNTDGLFLL